MPAYWVARSKVIDPVEYKKYTDLVPAIVAKYGAFPPSFFPYGDNVIDELVTVFKVPAAGVYTFEASVANGGAHTGSECCGLGVTVTGDAFSW